MRETEKLKSIEKVIDIMNLFSTDTPELGVSEISRLLKMSKSTVHRLLASLENAGLVKQSKSTLKYSLGYKIIQLANVLTSQLDIKEIALPYMRDLRDEINETAALHIIRDHERICIAQVESTQELRRTYRELGCPLPLYMGSPGKVMMAFLSQEDIEEIKKNIVLEALQSTINLQKLDSDMGSIRKCGYWVSKGERMMGIVSIAAPIFHSDGKVYASINISGPEFRLPDEKSEEYGKKVVKAANLISKALGSSVKLPV